MGYSYGRTASGRLALSCGACGKLGGVRKRTCEYRVYYADGTSLPYCPAPALCGPCFAERRVSLHADCRESAARSTEKEAAKGRRLAAGDSIVAARWGDWHETVPTGKVGAVYRAADGTETWILTDEAHMPRWLSEAMLAEPWMPHA